MITLFWDIDGTLLTTGKAGVPAWETAVLELTGSPFSLDSIRVPGLTDFQIAVKALDGVNVTPDDALVRRLVARYESLLPEMLPRKSGSVLPNVRAILDALGSHAHVRSYLLTGNTRAGARAKLGHYGLLEYFPDGAFAEDTRERATIAGRAMELARRHGATDADAVFVIGDTPHDVHCADAIGAQTIAVATGGYTEAELAEHRPWRVVPTLPTPEAFLTLLAEGVARVATSTPSAGPR